MSRPPRLYIFDADGTLRWTTIPGQRYPVRADQWRLMPNVAERLRAIPWSGSGPWLGIASNQHGVAEGLIGEAEARALLADMLTAALGQPPPGMRIELCICHEDAPCPRRKPAPGMLLRLLHEHGVEAHEALYVGDLPIDEAAAAAAGIPFEYAPSFFGWEMS